MLNICNKFGSKWDILFNPAKTQCVTFGGQASKNFIPVIGGKRLSWSFKLKYLGCTLMSGSCEVDISSAVGKFYSQFNNIMAVLGKQDNEMVAVYLMQSYCLSSLLYACETWSLTNNSAHSANVALNNSFERSLTVVGEKAQSFCCTTVGPCQLYLLLTSVVFCCTKTTMS